MTYVYTLTIASDFDGYSARDMRDVALNAPCVFASEAGAKLAGLQHIQGELIEAHEEEDGYEPPADYAWTEAVDGARIEWEASEETLSITVRVTRVELEQ